MIVAERKSVTEIKQTLEGYKKILIVGCGTCVAVCMAGGEREVGILASLLKMSFRMEGKEIEIGEITVERQCDKEFLQPLEEKIKDYQVVVSLACGIGIQFLAEMYDSKVVVPGVNTRFLGSNEGEGVWRERCRACGDCVLAETGGKRLEMFNMGASEIVCWLRLVASALLLPVPRDCSMVPAEVLTMGSARWTKIRTAPGP